MKRAIVTQFIMCCVEIKRKEMEMIGDGLRRYSKRCKKQHRASVFMAKQFDLKLDEYPDVSPFLMGYLRLNLFDMIVGRCCED